MAEKEELLLMLEKDIASLYYCHYCVKLHRWHKSWGDPRRTWIQEKLPCKQHLLRDFLRIPLTCYFPYHHARLVMNQHLYGAKHGLSYRKFEKRTSIRFDSHRIVNSKSSQTRIVDDKLLVLSVRTISHSQGDPKVLRFHIESLAYQPCEHLTLNRGCPSYAPVQLPELAKDKTAPGHFAPCEQSLGSRTFCLTDYSIDITWGGTRKGYLIKLFVYHQIGDCRSPFDWSWRGMATMETVDEPRTTRFLECRQGIVRDRWNKADGIDETTHGK